MARKFKVPFAEQGDKTTVPDGQQLDGAVSYTQGYGPDYEKEDGAPDSKPIERAKSNAILHDITGALIEIQNSGVIPWDATVTYAANASWVSFGGSLYKALTSNVNKQPSLSSTDWQQIAAISDIIDGNRSNVGASEKALGDVNKKAMIADEKAVNSGLTANSALKTANDAIPKKNISQSVNDKGTDTVPSSLVLNIVTAGIQKDKVNYSDNPISRGINGEFQVANNIGTKSTLKWGQTSTTSAVFPTAFPNDCFFVMICPIVSSTQALAGTAWEVRSYSRTGWTGGLSAISKYYYIAIGH